jgi:hypothetical protein
VFQCSKAEFIASINPSKVSTRLPLRAKERNHFHQGPIRLGPASRHMWE